MEQYDEREHVATGIRFAPVGYVASVRSWERDAVAMRCSRCHALIVENEDEQARHAEQHARVDQLAEVVREVNKSIGVLIDTIEHVAARPVGSETAQRTNDEHRAARIAAYRDAIAAGRLVAATGSNAPVATGWHETATGHALAIGGHLTAARLDAIEAADRDDAPIGVDAAAWTDSASVREVPPS